MASPRFEIIVLINGKYQYLDTYGVNPVSLNYQVTNITDISSVKSDGSLTIQLPETKNNRFVTDFLSDLSADSNVNVNKKVPCNILNDTIPVMTGYLQFKNIIKDLDTKETKLEVVVYGNNRNFFVEMGDLFISDIDLSIYSHTYSYTNVVNSWTSNYTNGFYYGLADYGNNWTTYDMSLLNPNGKGVVVQDMFPATYVKPIVDRIFNDQNFTYNITSTDFQNKFYTLKIPFTDKLERNATFSTNKEFGVVTPIPGLETYYTYPTGLPAFNYANLTSLILSNIFPTIPFGIVSPLVYNTSDNSGVRLLMTNTAIGAYDPFNFWSNTLFRYINNTGQLYKQRFSFNIDLWKYFDVPAAFNNTTAAPNYIRVIRQKNSAGVSHPNWPYKGYNLTLDNGNGQIDINQLTPVSAPGIFPIQYSITGQTNWTDGLGLPAENRYPLFPNEELALEYNTCFVNPNGLGGFNSIPGNVPLTSYNVNFFQNEVSLDVVAGGYIDYNEVLPKNIKQRDFILSLQKKFNLIFEPDRDIPNQINICPRDEYYAQGITKDYSLKVDINKPITEQIIAETQNKEIDFQYKNDSDYFNTDYLTKWNQNYGSKKFISDNDWVTGTKVIETIFSPTPTVNIPGINNNASQMWIPKIVKLNNNIFTSTTCNIRILQGPVNGYVLFPNFNPLDFNQSWYFEGIVQNGFPYMGHFNHPYNPTFDLNFDQTFGLYGNQISPIIISPTDNNLYNAYYYKMITEMFDKDSRLVTCEMYLTSQDISTFRFNDNIFIDFGDGAGQYYKVNSITNYDPTSVTTCTVELIKTLFISPFVSSLIPAATQVLNNGNNISIGNADGTNTYGSNNTGVFGKINTSNGNNSLIVGNLNDNYSGGNLINGNSNFIGALGTGSQIFGDNNIVNAPNSFVVGSDVTVNEPNQIILAGAVVNYINLVNAGRDVVLDLFPQATIINKISGGIDSVGGLSTNSLVNKISGGRF